MKILNLKADNFLSYESLDLNLADLGLVLVEGENRDDGGSNGAGKSAIFESLAWCLFGVTTRGIRGDDVVRLDQRKTPVKNTRVVVTLDVDGHTVEVLRHRKHVQCANKLILIIDGKDVTLSTDKETQERLERVLQLNFDSFVSAVMFPQGAAGFASLSDADQKEILDRILGTQRFGEAQARAKARLKKMSDGLQAIRATRIAKQNQAEQLERHINDLNVLIANFDQLKKEKIAALEKSLADLGSEPKCGDYAAAIASKRDEIARLSLSQLYQKLQTTLKQYQEVDKQLAVADSRYETLKQQVAAAGVQPPRPADDARVLEQKQAELRQQVAQKRFCLADLQRKKAETIALQQRRDTTLECPTCGQELSESAKNHLFGSLLKSAESFDTEIQVVQNDLTILENQYTQITSALADAVRLGKDYEQWEARTASASLLPGAADIVAAAREKLSACKQEYETLAADYKQKYEVCSRLNSELQELEARKKREEDEQREWVLRRELFQKQLESAMRDTCPYHDLLEKQVREWKEVRASLEWANLIEQTIQKDCQYLEFWAEGFGNAGVKSLLLDTVTPYLSYRASEYLEELTGGRAKIEFCSQRTLASGEKRDKFEIAVSYNSGGDSYRSISGGERRRIDLAALFALGDLAASRSFAPPKLRLLDEPFDNLDSTGAEAVVNVLRRKVLPASGTVLVMSHDESLKALIDKRLVVVKEGGVSRVEFR